MFYSILGDGILTLSDLARDFGAAIPENGLLWRTHPGIRLASLARTARELIGYDQPWSHVVVCAKVADSVIAKRAAEAATDFADGLAEGEVPKSDLYKDLTSPEGVIDRFGRVDLLTYEVLPTFKNAFEHADSLDPIPYQTEGVAVVAAYALRMFDEAATAVETGSAALAMERLSEGADALKCAAMEHAVAQSRLHAASAHSALGQVLAAMHTEAAKTRAHARWDKSGLNGHRKEALRIAESQPFKSRAKAAEEAVAQIRKPDGSYYTFDTVDDWLKDAGWVGKMTWAVWCATNRDE
jgi:hypothetical protein